MQDYIEINVSLNGKHLFATAPRSLNNEMDARLLYNLFYKKFPANEGYKIHVTSWKGRGHQLEWEGGN